MFDHFFFRIGFQAFEKIFGIKGLYNLKRRLAILNYDLIEVKCIE
jgi:hypothetical protein